MDFARYTIALLIRPPHADGLHEAEAAALQDAHMSHVADLHEAGALLAAGPIFDERYRGLAVFNVEPQRAHELEADDPAVRAGLYEIDAATWLLPGGLVTFTPGRLPRSMAEASGG